MRYPKVDDILNIMEQWAPSWLAEPWDNVGLLAGSKNAQVKEAWIALDCSSALLNKAMIKPAGKMLLFHHPPIFKPLKNLLSDKPAQATLLKAAVSGLNLFAAHTNLDAAAQGVNQALANCLGLVDCQVLEPCNCNPWLKLAVLTPQEHAASLMAALFKAGAGQLGNYQQCAFSYDGQGQFLPLDQATPALGKKNQLTTVAEKRVEMMLPQTALGRVMQTLYQHHPYEEPAFDIIALHNTPRGLGMGRVGNLPKPVAGKDFLTQAAGALKAGGLQYAGVLPKQVQRVAVLGGSGANSLAAAKQAGAQVFITGEASYHAAQEAEGLGICLVVLGHYPTEAVIILPWLQKLKEELKLAGFNCQLKAPASRDIWTWQAF